MRRAKEISDEQQARSNTRLVENFTEGNARNQTLAEEIRHLKNRHTVTLTCIQRRHPASIYYS